MDSNLPSIEELYPHLVRLKHKGEPPVVALKVMKFLESSGILIHKDFYLDMQDDPDRVLVYFRKGKHAKIFKKAKKQVRDAEG